MRLALVAGEASGDLLASLMLQGLKARWPGLQSGGIGGPRMVEQGFEAWAPSERLSVFGYVDAIKRLPELLWLRRRTRQRLLRERPDVFVGVDAPDFNFGLETALRKGGLRTVHFVCPSIWAWRPERVQRLKAAADHVLCLFPFEPELLAAQGVSASYVGHPLADAIPLEVDRAAAREALGFGRSGQALVALLPGSRRAEIRHIAPL
ncbi:MAG: lipid-A-disaccharide synthase, partial [Betaproteobacteria bacterium]